jgi:hypothetical protein
MAEGHVLDLDVDRTTIKKGLEGVDWIHVAQDGFH